MEVKVYIRPNGEVEISVEGVKGNQCVKLTEFLEKELGEVTTRELKPTYYEKATVVQKLPVGIG
jgi:acylphosphatase